MENVPEAPSLAQIGGNAFHDWAHDREYARLIRSFHVDPFDVYLEQQLAKAEQESGLDRLFFKASGRKTKDHPDKEDIAVWRDELGPDMVAKFGAFDWGDWRIADDLPPDSSGKTLGLEYHIEVPGCQGYADRIEKDGRGNYRVVDYKTGARIYKTAQLQLYMTALQILGVRAVYGGIYNARKAELTTQASRWSRHTFDDYVSRYATGIDAKFYLPVPGDHCGWCAVSAHCAFSVA